MVELSAVRRLVEGCDDGDLSALRLEVDGWERARSLPADARLRDVAGQAFGEVNVLTVSAVVAEVWRTVALRLETAG